MLAKALNLIRSARHLFLDWDGCIGRGEELLPGAREFLRRFAHKTTIISNNSTELPEDFVRRLAADDLTFPAERILLAGQQTIEHVRARFGAGPVYLLGNGRMCAYARTRGVRLAEKKAVAVVLLRDTTFSYRKLANAAALLDSGRPLIVSNPDRSHPGAHGRPVPETGALLEALKACVGRQVLQETLIGKPAPVLFSVALERLGAHPQQVVMVGDNIETDIKGARRLGLANILLDERQFTLATLNASLKE